MLLSVLYHDSYLIAVNKPSGLLVHRSGLDPHATEFAMQAVRDQIGAQVFPVHRLDRATSGTLLFALNTDIARELSAAFAARAVSKTYLAIVRGTAPESAHIDYPLKEELDAITDKAARLDKPAQEAVTDITRLAQIELPHQVDKYPTTRYSLVEARPLTGRKHQIRRHMRHLRYPIIGDVTYGSGKHNRFFHQHFGVKRLLLACTQIEFAHPHSKQTVTIKAPLTNDFARVINQLGWSTHVPE
jgi:tRNA pseudouridine65 synthase